ncbi:MAG: SDR family oxidoreductase [Oscillospiraceae bacterium]|nr:SDR family oxidoreductase [Oscillospiraceae bacterium]
MKSILILGASSDIAMGYIKHLEKSHSVGEARVIAHYRTTSPAFEELVACAKNVPIEIIQADLSLQKEVETLISAVREYCTAPTHIVHLAAGRFHHMRFRALDSEIIRTEMEIQVYSFAEILKTFLPVMAKARYGRIAVMLSAYTCGIPPRFVTDYAVCKYALLGLIKAVAAEYCDKGICINGLSPSMVETKFLGGIDSRIVEMSAESSPLKRNMKISEVVAAIEFLLSDENAYMCGTNLNLSGGEVLA